jgi:sugar phosphate isomerase/epimerase
MSQPVNRRAFLKQSAGLAVAAGLAATWNPLPAAEPESLFKISLAGWSLHKTIFGGKLDHLDFAKAAKNDYGINAVEYVNQFFKDKAKDMKYLGELKKRAGDLGVTSVLIMIDREGDLGNPDAAQRTKAVENHYKWVEAAKFLGCHSIRVNARSQGSPDEQKKLAADGLRRLSEFGGKHNIGVIVENHGGLSSNGEWLASVIQEVGNKNCGTLPDFGNFRLGKGEEYDRYKGTQELMPYAKGVSAKSYAFDDKGNETKIDYLKIMKIVMDAGYHSYVGIEYEGSKLGEPEGILATKKLLERVRKELAG